MRTPIATILCAVVLLTAGQALAAWAPSGNPVIAVGGDQYGIAATVMPGGPVVIAWEDLRSGESTPDVYAQALRGDGSFEPGWPSAGLPISRAPGFQRYLTVASDAEGAYIAWVDARSTPHAVYMQRVTRGGALASGWPVDGLRISATITTLHTVIADGTGGAFIAWVDPSGTHRLQRITASAMRGTGWPEEGLALGTDSEGDKAALLADGGGGVFVARVGPRQASFAGPVIVQRFAPDGSPNPTWPAGGVELGAQGYYMRGGLQVVPDTWGGLYLGWIEHTGVICLDARSGCGVTQSAVHLSGVGSLHRGWPSEGLLLGEEGSILSDGTGGILHVWDRGFGFLGLPAPYQYSRVSRFDASGRLTTGWLGGGNRVCTEDGYQYLLRGVSDGTGGALLTWLDSRTFEPELYMSRLDASGNVAPGWPVTGSIGALVSGWPGELQIVGLGDGGAIAIWVEQRSGSRDVFADIVVPGEPGPPAPLANVFDRPVGFRIAQVRPNPTRGAFWAVLELPEAGAATMQLVDLSGRVLESSSIDPGGPARGAVQFNTARRLSPGVYWMHIRQGSRSAATRVVLLQ